MPNKVLSYKKVSGYSPILSINQKAFLKKYERKTLLSIKLTAFIYVLYKIFLIAILISAISYSMNIIFILMIVLVLPLFISIVDRELYSFAIRKIAFSSKNSTFYKFALKDANGWYDDPYANGLPNQQREWVAGKWTKNIRFFSAQATQNGTY